MNKYTSKKTGQQVIIDSNEKVIHAKDGDTFALDESRIFVPGGIPGTENVKAPVTKEYKMPVVASAGTGPGIRVGPMPTPKDDAVRAKEDANKALIKANAAAKTADEKEAEIKK